MPKENDLEGERDMGGKHGGQAGIPKPETRSAAALKPKSAHQSHEPAKHIEEIARLAGSSEKPKNLQKVQRKRT